MGLWRDQVGDREPQQPPMLTALIDKEQLAHKLALRVGEVVAHATQNGFPRPVAYFRGRMLWDEAAIDHWLQQRAADQKR
jgi:predicted DNA-binding transcriptional regulator AlpA